MGWNSCCDVARVPRNLTDEYWEAVRSECDHGSNYSWDAQKIALDAALAKMRRDGSSFSGPYSARMMFSNAVWANISPLLGSPILFSDDDPRRLHKIQKVDFYNSGNPKGYDYVRFRDPSLFRLPTLSDGLLYDEASERWDGKGYECNGELEFHSGKSKHHSELKAARQNLSEILRAAALAKEHVIIIHCILQVKKGQNDIQLLGTPMQSILLKTKIPIENLKIYALRMNRCVLCTAFSQYYRAEEYFGLCSSSR